MKLQEDLFKDLTKIAEKDLSNFHDYDFDPKQIFNAINAFGMFNYPIVKLESSDIDNALQCIKKFTSGDTRFNLIQKYERDRETLEEMSKRNSYRSNYESFKDRLETDISHRKSWNKKRDLEQELERLYPEEKFKDFDELKEKIKPLFLRIFFENALDQINAVCEEIDLKEIESLIKKIEE